MLGQAYDGIFVNIVINCVRKKFNFRVALSSLTIFLLAVPAFLGKMLGCSAGGFNVAKLSSSAKGMIMSTAKGKVKEAKATRIVRQRLHVGGMGAVAMITIPHADLPGDENDNEAGDDDGGDDGGGGDD